MDASTGNCNTGETIDIVPDGDVVLVVGHQKQRLRVQSHILKCASKVFAVMLSPAWKEGRELLENQSLEIALEDDDPDAMTIICHVIHHSSEPETEHPTPDMALRLGVIADKYNLITALKFASTSWLDPEAGPHATGNLSLLDQGRFMAAAYLLGNKRMFSKHSSSLTFNHTKSYRVLLHEELIARALSAETILMLEECRSKMQTVLMSIMVESMGTCDGCRENAVVYSQRGELENIVKKHTPRGIRGVSVSNVVDMMRKVLERSVNTSGTIFWCEHTKIRSPTQFMGKINSMREKASLCVDCVFSGTPCCHDHEIDVSG